MWILSSVYSSWTCGSSSTLAWATAAQPASLHARRELQEGMYSSLPSSPFFGDHFCYCAQDQLECPDSLEAWPKKARAKDQISEKVARVIHTQHLCLPLGLATVTLASCWLTHRPCFPRRNEKIELYPGHPSSLFNKGLLPSILLLGSPSHFPPKRECGGILSVNLLIKALLCPQSLLQKWQPAVGANNTLLWASPFPSNRLKAQKIFKGTELGLQIISEMTWRWDQVTCLLRTMPVQSLHGILRRTKTFALLPKCSYWGVRIRQASSFLFCFLRVPELWFWNFCQVPEGNKNIKTFCYDVK